MSRRSSRSRPLDEPLEELPEEEEFLEDSDDDADFDAGAGDSEEEEERGSKRKSKQKDKKKRKRAPQFVEEEADEDEDDEDEEDGEGPAAAARKKPKGNRFVDDIAAVDDEDEEDEADEDVEDMIDKDEELPDEGVGGGAATGSYRLLMREREEKTEEELARYLEERYKQSDYGEYMEDDGRYEQSAVMQQGLLPTPNDPKLWMVTCKLGHEREACIQLMQKYTTMAERGTPLHIRGATCLDHLQGYLYVEADKADHVKDAVRGLRNIYGSKAPKLVPLSEMVDAISIPKAARAPIHRDSWVRLKTGLYKDDLAKVIDIDYASNKATIMVVPRLDLKAIKARQDGATGPDGAPKALPFGRTGPVRPPPRPFTSSEAQGLGLTVMRDRYEPGLMVLNTHRFKDGYTIRSVAVKSLIPCDSAPPLDEIAKFNAAAQANKEDTFQDPESDLNALVSALPEGTAPKTTFLKGDKVVVVSGDLLNLEGVVEGIDELEGSVLVRPTTEGMEDDVVDLQPAELRKFFRVGDHARVLTGKHIGEAGMVVRVEDAQVVLLSDTTKAELRVFARELTEAAEEPKGVTLLGDQYQLHDVVVLDENTVGIIIMVEREAARVMTSQSTLDAPDIRVCRLPDIRRRANNAQRAITRDSFSNPIRVNDSITVIDGPARNKTGTVQYVYKDSLFIKSPELQNNGGFAVIKARVCKVAGGEKTRATMGPQQTPGGTMYTPQSPAAHVLESPAGFRPGNRPGAMPLASPAHQPGGAAVNPFGGSAPGFSGGRGGGGGGGRGHGGRSVLIGKEVKVSKGPYSGYKGRITQETGTHVRLELDALSRIVTIPKEHITAANGTAGSFTPGYQPQGGAGFTPGYQSQRIPAPGYQSVPVAAGGGGYGRPTMTPMHPSMTPMHASMAMTPMHPSQTPMHPSMTPRHNPSATPAHPSFGARTPMHPSFGARTPMHPGMGTSDGDRDGATPYGGYGNDAYHAPTPGRYPNAPTPGYHGAANTAETPYAETPGGMTANTPGIDTGYPPAPTPGSYGAGLDAAPTPGMDTAQTPGGGYGYGTGYTPLGATPGLAATPGLPLGVTPLGATPNVPFTPGDPGVGAFDPSGNMPGLPLDAAQLPPDYSGVMVRLPGDAGEGTAREAAADGSIPVALSAGGEVRLAAGAAVELSPAEKQDTVKVVSGQNRGYVGKLIAIDGAEGIVRGTDGGTVVVDMGIIGRLVG